MTRSITATNITESEKEVVRIALLVDLAFDSGTVYVNNTPITITYNSNNYLGVGALGAISAVTESAELKANSIELQLTGVDPSYITIALGTGYKGNIATLYLAFLDSTYALVDDPVVIFKGIMDTMDVDLGPESTITMTVENRLADWERPRIRRYTNEDQQQEYSGDLGLEFVSQIVEKQLVWGKA